MAKRPHQDADRSLHEDDYCIEKIAPEPPDPDPEQRYQQYEQGDTGVKEQEPRVYLCHERHDRDVVELSAGLQFGRVETVNTRVDHGGLDDDECDAGYEDKQRDEKIPEEMIGDLHDSGYPEPVFRICCRMYYYPRFCLRRIRGSPLLTFIRSSAPGSPPYYPGRLPCMYSGSPCTGASRDVFSPLAGLRTSLFPACDLSPVCQADPHERRTFCTSSPCLSHRSSSACCTWCRPVAGTTLPSRARRSSSSRG